MHNSKIMYLHKELLLDENGTQSISHGLSIAVKKSVPAVVITRRVNHCEKSPSLLLVPAELTVTL